LQEYTRLKAAEEHAELAWRLVLESMIFRAEAEIRWLDHTEAVVARAEPQATLPFGVGESDSADAESEVNRSRSH
jgi:hypothetical protein